MHGNGDAGGSSRSSSNSNCYHHTGKTSQGIWILSKHSMEIKKNIEVWRVIGKMALTGKQVYDVTEEHGNMVESAAA